MADKPPNPGLLRALRRAQESSEKAQAMGEASRRLSQGAMSAILSGQRSCRPEKVAPKTRAACPLRDPSAPCISPSAPQELDALLPARSPDSAPLRGASAGAEFLAFAAAAALVVFAALLASPGAKK